MKKNKFLPIFILFTLSIAVYGWAQEDEAVVSSATTVAPEKLHKLKIRLLLLLLRQNPVMPQKKSVIHWARMML